MKISFQYQGKYVRTSKLISLILLIGISFGQSDMIVIDNADTVEVDAYKFIPDTLNGILLNSDEIGDFFKLHKIATNSILKYDRIINKIYVDSIIAKNSKIRIPIFYEIFKPLINTVPINKTNKKFSQIINSYSFVTDSSTIQYGLYKKDKIGAVVDMKTNFNNYFSGLIGASNQDDQWSVNGQIDIHLENQWRTANLIDLHWQRLDDESQTLEIAAEEPHPFGLPIGVGISFNQDLREGSYIDNESAAGIIKTVPGIAKFGFGGKTVNINVTTKGDSLGIADLSSRLLYIDGHIDKRNDYWLPNDGYFLSINADIGNREVRDSSSISVSLNAEIENYFKISSTLNILLKFIAQGMWLNEGNIHDGELIRYGGVNNLRGYTEDKFKSEWVIIPSIEFNWDIGLYQKLTFFTDLAIQNKYEPFPYGLGVGLTQVTKNSVFKLFYGIGRGDKIKNGKIHLQFLTKL